MSASLSDILTAAKNIVTAINSAAQTYLNVNGTSSQTAITSTTLIRSGQGRLAAVVVVTGGSATGAIYDVSSATLTTNQIGIIPTVPGVYVFNIPYNNGLVIAPGTGQKITVSYS